jgi:malate synthase
VTMDKAFLKAYVEALIQTCHRRGIHAMGGMAAQIPIKGDTQANAAAIEKVRQDKLREVHAGHDGTWVAHPGLIPTAMKVFQENMRGENQISVTRENRRATQSELLTVPTGDITEEGLRLNIDVGIRYLAAWLDGLGCVPIYHLMEDAATAEISRTQVWQWTRHKARTKSGSVITPEWVQKLIPEELSKIEKDLGTKTFASGKFSLAGRIFEDISLKKDCPEFLTLAAYEYLD